MHAGSSKSETTLDTQHSRLHVGVSASCSHDGPSHIQVRRHRRTQFLSGRQQPSCLYIFAAALSADRSFQQLTVAVEAKVVSCPFIETPVACAVLEPIVCFIDAKHGSGALLRGVPLPVKARAAWCSRDRAVRQPASMDAPHGSSPYFLLDWGLRLRRSTPVRHAPPSLIPQHPSPGSPSRTYRR